MAKHTIDELRQWQALPLNLKIRMTEERIRMWVRNYGEDGVYVSFSGGKDSTVLLDIVRRRMGYTDVPAVFVDTGLEYPEIRDFVKTFDNVVWLKPKMQFRKVIEKYGYPMFSKENSLYIRQCQNPTEKNQTTRNLRLNGIRSDGVKVQKGQIPKSLQFMVNAPFKISEQCCDEMKKKPLHKATKEMGRFPMTAEMAHESRLRTQKWLENGCNGYQLTIPKSTPMAFWTEQDVLQYIRNNAKVMVEYRKERFESKLDWTEEEYEAEYANGEWGAICSVYGDIVTDESKAQNCDGQLEFTEKGICESTTILKTSCMDRTGCMFCGFGCHLEKEGEGRFEKMKVTHPKQYEWIMRDWDKGGLGYKKVIDWINEHGNLNIRY